MIDKLLDKIPGVSCQEATRLMSLSLDRRLSFKEWMDMRLHALVCGLCQRFEVQIKGLQKIVQAYSNSSTTEQKLSEEARTQIKKALRPHIH